MHDSREDTEAPFEEKKSRADGMWSRDRYDERYLHLISYLGTKYL